MRIKNFILSISTLTFLLVGCSEAQVTEAEKKIMKDPIDRELNLSRSEMKDAIRPSSEDKERMKDEEKIRIMTKNPPKLDFSSAMITPEAPDVRASKRITLSVTESVDIKDVMQELSRLSGLELALDPNIKGGVILSVINRPVNEVLEMISNMADLKYSVEKGVLKVSRDTPYLANYNVDFLNVVRSSSGSINTQTKVLSSTGSSGSGGGGGGGGGGSGSQDEGMNSGSTNVISNFYSGDLWKSVEENLVAILGSNAQSQKTNEVAATQEISASDVASKAVGADAQSKPEDKSKEQARTLISAAAKAQSAPGYEAAASTYYTLNKQAGIVSVMANSKKHKAVSEYLDRVKQSVSAQVLIEAKVIEVNLYEQYATGIDWRKFSVSGLRGKFSYGPEINKVFTDGNIFSGVIPDSNIDVATSKSPKLLTTLQFIEGFGETRTLSNPRVTIMNNQQAVLSFARNQTYYTVTGSLQQNSTINNGGNVQNVNTPITISSQLHTIPIGVILALQPSIDLERQEVTLHIRPTLSTQLNDGMNDPAVELLKQSILSAGNVTNQSVINSVEAISSKVPIVQVRELDTVLKAKSGDVMIIGGLIQHDDQNSDSGVPFLSRIPIIGNAAKRVEKSSNIIETVILMQASIISPKAHYHKADKNLYETFTQDPRPLLFD